MAPGGNSYPEDHARPSGTSVRACRAIVEDSERGCEEGAARRQAVVGATSGAEEGGADADGSLRALLRAATGNISGGHGAGTRRMWRVFVCFTSSQL